MHAFLRIATYISAPALFGVLIAVVVILLYPERYPVPLREWIFPGQAELNKQNDSAPVSYADAVQRAAPSVVNIYTLRKLTYDSSTSPMSRMRRRQENRVMRDSGSGVIISEDGYIITNSHVVSSILDIRVALQDGREVEPEIVGVSGDDDMAILKINLDNLVAIPIGNLDSARVGDVVLAIGNVFNVGQTVTQGIISGTHRRGLNISTYENFIQTDAAINPGNSGGALVDARGNLLGINIAKLTDDTESEGIGFAIPVDRVMSTLQDIIEHGRVMRGWLGVVARDLNRPLANRLGLEETAGILITNVQYNSPAHIAGIQRGDVVRSIGEQKIYALDDMKEIVLESKPGDTHDFGIWRNGEEISLQVVLADAPE